MPHTFVILGASGDLTHRKLVPALYHLFRKGRLPKDTRIVGFSRTAFTHEEWRSDLAKAVARFVGNDFDPALWDQLLAEHLLSRRRHRPGRRLHNARQAPRTKSKKARSSTRVYYLATAPQFYGPAVEQLGRSGLADENGGKRRVIIEKPFGTDLASARQLNEVVHAVFSEQQVYRIDHYLGKETVQNMLVLRFANTIFEPIWNRNYIDHVQITVAEEVDVGRRAGYYDSAGVVRDMFQNHLLQLADDHGHGSAGAVRSRRRPQRKGEGAAGHSPDEARGCATATRSAASIAATQSRRRPPRQPHRHFRRDQALDRQLALARRAVLLAQRQGDVVPHHANRRPIPRAAAHAVPRRPEKRFRMPTGSSFKCSRPKECSWSSKRKCPTPA